MTVTTNNHKRELLTWWDLTDKEQDDLDYASGCQFFRYHGYVYDLGQFLRLDPSTGWDGSYQESAWGGVVVKVLEDSVIVGTAHC